MPTDRPSKKQKAPSSKELVDMDSTGGVLADHFSVGAFGSNRAGRSTAMAKATGKKPGFNVENPITAANLGGLAGAGIGGLAGAGIGAGIGHFAGGLGDTEAGAGIGGLLGVGAGTLLGVILTNQSRRNQMKQIGKDYDATRAAGRLKPQDADTPGLIRGALTPMSGQHHVGEAETVHKLRTGQGEPGEGASTVMNTIRHTPYVGSAAALPFGWADNIRAGDTAALTQKAASMNDILTSLLKRAGMLDQAMANPGLAGAGIGVAGGILAYLLSDDEKKSLIGNMIIGGGLGGLAGMGAGHLMNGQGAAPEAAPAAAPAAPAAAAPAQLASDQASGQNSLVGQAPAFKAAPNAGLELPPGAMQAAPKPAPAAPAGPAPIEAPGIKGPSSPEAVRKGFAPKLEQERKDGLKRLGIPAKGPMSIAPVQHPVDPGPTGLEVDPGPTGLEDPMLEKDGHWTTKIAARFTALHPPKPRQLPNGELGTPADAAQRVAVGAGVAGAGLAAGAAAGAALNRKAAPKPPATPAPAAPVLQKTNSWTEKIAARFNVPAPKRLAMPVRAGSAVHSGTKAPGHAMTRPATPKPLGGGLGVPVKPLVTAGAAGAAGAGIYGVLESLKGSTAGGVVGGRNAQLQQAQQAAGAPPAP